MSWKSYLKGYEDYLKLERSLSEHSIDGYLRDVRKLKDYIQLQEKLILLQEISIKDLEGFILYLNELGLEASSQARIISGLKSFFRFLVLEDAIAESPSDLLEGPKLSRNLPSVLTYDQINQMLKMATLEKNENLRLRNLAIIETLYACGLRVTELTELKLSNLFLDVKIIKITGKGDKERLIPIGEKAIERIMRYLTDVHGRNTVSPKAGHEDILFLNRRGRQLTRVMIFTIVKKLAHLAGIQQKVSPHTFRHSFATHLIEGGASLRAIQDMLGHESITTTEIYTHLDADFLRDTILTFHPSNKKD